MVPGLNSFLSFKIPENGRLVTISLDEPKRVVFRARHEVSSLHHPPPYHKQKLKFNFIINKVESFMIC